MLSFVELCYCFVKKSITKGPVYAPTEKSQLTSYIRLRTLNKYYCSIRKCIHIVVWNKETGNHTGGGEGERGKKTSVCETQQYHALRSLFDEKTTFRSVSNASGFGRIRIKVTRGNEFRDW